MLLLLKNESILLDELCDEGASQVALVVKNPPAKAGDARDSGSIPGLGRSPGVRNGNPLQYSCLENSTARGACGLQFMGLQRVRHDWVTERTYIQRLLLADLLTLELFFTNL